MTADGPRTFLPTSSKKDMTCWVLTLNSDANSCTLMCVKTASASTARPIPCLFAIARRPVDSSSLPRLMPR